MFSKGVFHWVMKIGDLLYGKRLFMVVNDAFPLFLAHLSMKCSRVSFCDRPVSVVRHLLSILDNLFKHLLLNHWDNLDETWQKCSLCEVLP